MYLTIAINDRLPFLIVSAEARSLPRLPVAKATIRGLSVGGVAEQGRQVRLHSRRYERGAGKSISSRQLRYSKGLCFFA
jgi:hypothetical protein